MSEPAPNLRSSRWHSFFKHARLFKALALASFQADLEYRANFISRIATDIVWYAAQILTFETLFLHTANIGGWNAPQMRVFLGTLFVADALYMIFFHDNMQEFPEKVRKGDLDLLLMKPVSSQFFMSLQRIATALVGNLLIGLGWLTWALWHLEDFNPGRLLWLVILIPSGVLVLYTIRIMMATMSIIFTRSDSLQYLWFQFYKLGMRPDSLYQPWLKYMLMSFLPVLVIAAIPARALTQKPEPGLYLYSVLLCSFLLWVSGRFWRYALSKHTSASS